MNDDGYDIAKQEMIDRFEDWADRLVDKDLLDRFEYVPDSVLIMACLQLAARKVAHRRDLLTPQTAQKLFQQYLDDLVVHNPTSA